MVVLYRVLLRGAARRKYGRFLPGRQHWADLGSLVEQLLPQMPCSYRLSNRAKDIPLGRKLSGLQRRHSARHASEVLGEW
jgi:hypothetical protein